MVAHSRQSGKWSFADRLNALYRDWPGTEVLTNDVVAEGSGVSSGYLSELRRGVKTNATLALAEKLADWFAIDPCYFISDENRAHEILEEYRSQSAITQSDDRHVAFSGRARGAEGAVIPEHAAREIADTLRAETLRYLRQVGNGEDESTQGDGDEAVHDKDQTPT